MLKYFLLGLLVFTGCSFLRNPNNPLMPVSQDYNFNSGAKMGFSFPPVKDEFQRGITMAELNNLKVKKNTVRGKLENP